jgi:aminoglycoside 6-adenylyltransferase
MEPTGVPDDGEHPGWDYDAFLAGVVEWAADRDDLRAVVVIGSRARDDGSADRWSDLDLVLVTAETTRYIDDADWLDSLGDPWLTFCEATATGDAKERRAVFAPGLDVDFIPLPPALFEDPPSEVARVFSTGYRVIYDAAGFESALSTIPDTPVPEVTRPTTAAFRETATDAWYHALWVAKKLRRGERWAAKGGLDGYLTNRCLLPLLKWHAIVVHDRDPSHGDRFVDDWADARWVDALPETFARYDLDDCWRALAATMTLVDRVAGELADELDVEYPVDGQREVAALVERLAPIDGWTVLESGAAVRE